MRSQLGSVVIALVLSCLPVQMMVCESVSAQTTSDRKAEADRLLKQSYQQYYKSQYREAFQSWEQALQIYREIKNRNGEATLLNNLGTV